MSEETGDPVQRDIVVRPTSTAGTMHARGIAMHVWMAGLIIASTMLLAACDTPSPASRPRDGAPVGVANRTPQGSGALVVPPTLAPAIAREHTPVPSSLQPSLPSPTTTPTHVIAATGVGPVNMRAGPSMSAPVITTLREGTLVEALGDPVSAEGRDWRPIRSGEQNGWVVAVVVHDR